MAAEFIGTLLLAVTVGVSVGSIGRYLGYEALYLPLIVGVIIAVLVYTLGSVSGAHFNPAVSFGLWVIRKLPGINLIAYLFAQVAGAYAGFWLAQFLVGPIADSPSLNDREAIVAELLGAALLVFAVTRVVMGRVKAGMEGWVIGAALAVGVTLSMGSSGGILNPALAIALGSFHVSYLAGPLLGGVVGAGLAFWFDE